MFPTVFHIVSRVSFRGGGGHEWKKAHGDASFLGGARADVKDCATSASKCTVKAISMDPPFPQKGDDYDYKINFVCDVDVTGGDLHFKAYKNGLKIVDKTKDLCEGLADSQTPCPWTAGQEYDIVSKQTVTEDFPSGRLKSITDYINQDGEELICAEIDLKLQ